MELVEDAVLAPLKAGLMALVRKQVSDQYRRYEMDISEEDVECIAVAALEIGSVM